MYIRMAQSRKHNTSIRSPSLAVDKQHKPSLPRTFPPTSCFVSKWPNAPEKKIKMRSMVIMYIPFTHIELVKYRQPHQKHNTHSHDYTRYPLVNILFSSNTNHKPLSPISKPRELCQHHHLSSSLRTQSQIKRLYSNTPTQPLLSEIENTKPIPDKKIISRIHRIRRTQLLKTLPISAVAENTLMGSSGLDISV